METTFMTIHNLTPEANILYASESITEILGYDPHEVTGRSCFDYFHPDEVPFARNVHSRGVELDKAAVLHYARIRGQDGSWIGCECVFTVVYEVLVACTSIYRGDEKNERRAVDAPAIRRLFTSSPRDPRYHMLEHLSSKFRSPPQPSLLEPRAALILNRFSETLPVMYATKAVQEVLGVSAEVLDGKSFYECIQEECLREAIRCLESAKANDSIAYLRFRRRDPRRQAEIEEARMREASQSSDSDEGGVELNNRMDVDREPSAIALSHAGSSHETSEGSSDHRGSDGGVVTSRQDVSRTPSAENAVAQVLPELFDRVEPLRSASSSVVPVPDQPREEQARPAVREELEPYEVEAVVSCTSDGLVVILRRARPLVPFFGQLVAPNDGNGLFAAPWGVNPIRPHVYHPDPQVPFVHGLQAPPVLAGGPPMDEFLSTIRDIAVFAWSLVGINGNIAAYGRGQPRGEAQPPGGIPVWDPYAQPAAPNYLGPDNQAVPRWQRWEREKPRDHRHGHRYPYPQRQQALRHQPGYGGYQQQPLQNPPGYGDYGGHQQMGLNSAVDNTSPTNQPQDEPGMGHGSNPRRSPWN